MLSFESEAIPLRRDGAGVIRVGSTRVSLDSLISAFFEGSTVESIAEQYLSVQLADIYLVLAFYLKHRTEVDVYLEEQRRDNDAIYEELSRRSSVQGLRERLLARRVQAASA